MALQLSSFLFLSQCFSYHRPEHGYLVGARGSFAETNDGGKTWEARSFSNLDAEEEVTYRFTVSSFTDGEGWVLGKPTLPEMTANATRDWHDVKTEPALCKPTLGWARLKTISWILRQ